MRNYNQSVSVQVVERYNILFILAEDCLILQTQNETGSVFKQFQFDNEDFNGQKESINN